MNLRTLCQRGFPSLLPSAVASLWHHPSLLEYSQAVNQVDQTNDNPTQHLRPPLASPHFQVPSTPAPASIGHGQFCIPQNAVSPYFSDPGYLSAASSSSNHQWTPQSSAFPQSPDFGYASASSSSSSSTPVHLTPHNSLPGKYKNFGEYIPEDNLPVDGTLRTKASNGKDVSWFFLLKLLVDPTKKSVIAWTGKGLEFRILDHVVLTAFWNRESRSYAKTSWETLKRNIRRLYSIGIIRTTEVRAHSYAFITEPSSHVNMSPKHLRCYIALNNICGPLTTGAPIGFALPASLYPKGTKLTVNRSVPLAEDGSPRFTLQPETVEVTLVEQDVPVPSIMPNFYNPVYPTYPHSLPMDPSMLALPYNGAFLQGTMQQNLFNNYSFHPY